MATKTAKQPQAPFKGLDGRWVWACAVCNATCVSVTEPKGPPYPCAVCTERAEARERKRLERQQGKAEAEAKKRRWTP